MHIFLFHMLGVPINPPQSPESDDKPAVVLENSIEAGEQGALAAEADRPMFMGGETMASVFPQWSVLFLSRGYCSTSLFFILSGFILGFLYIDGEGNQTLSNRDFWLSRWIRIYPLHIAVLPLLIPSVGFMLKMAPSLSLFQIPVSKEVFVGATATMSLLLVQAWCPEAALTWNFATWALSAVVFFYAMFPLVIRLLRGRSRTQLWVCFALMPLINLIPSITVLALNLTVQPMSFWGEFIMRTPLLWLPHFVMGIVLTRIFEITRHDLKWSKTAENWLPSWGDLAALLLLVIMCTPDATIQKIMMLGDRPAFGLIRHGLLAPLHCTVILSLARNQGWLARCLSWNGFEFLGEASFGIFILQGPIGFTLLFLVPIESVAVRLIVSVIGVVALSLLSVRYFERPVARRLRKRFAVGAT